MRPVRSHLHVVGLALIWTSFQNDNSRRRKNSVIPQLMVPFSSHAVHCPNILDMVYELNRCRTQRKTYDKLNYEKILICFMQNTGEAGSPEHLKELAVGAAIPPESIKICHDNPQSLLRSSRGSSNQAFTVSIQLTNSSTVSEGEWCLAKKQPYSMVLLPSLKALRNADSSIQDRSRKYSEHLRYRNQKGELQKCLCVREL
ncbi:hypothetical protein WN51_11824 [Melipona quadrifasciata]|uniref:Uncharacterized protein n=1 Tax=Melipona quadrifasciata TaxID=166423 RepID=A0A0M9A578_9HYME|nr:hypothetical protein WN51_11824 [Melipona quadrifasciata]